MEAGQLHPPCHFSCLVVRLWEGGTKKLKHSWKCFIVFKLNTLSVQRKTFALAFPPSLQRRKHFFKNKVIFVWADKLWFSARKRMRVKSARSSNAELRGCDMPSLHALTRLSVSVDSSLMNRCRMSTCREENELRFALLLNQPDTTFTWNQRSFSSKKQSVQQHFTP